MAFGRPFKPVSCVEHLRLHEAVAQAVNDADQKTPVVVSKRNRDGWLVTMRAEDWFKLLEKRERPSDPESRPA